MHFEQIITNLEKSLLPLTSECKEELKNVAKILSVSKGTLLVKEGQFADKAYFIGEGSLRAYYLKDGKDITDWFAFDNDFICAINSYFLNTPSEHFIEVLETSLLLEISRKQAELLAEKYPTFDKLSKIVLTKTILQQQQRIASIQFETAQQKYENLLRISPNITQKVPLMHIASYLGITLETLSRIRNPKNRI